MALFSKVLVANRGEIAVRVFRTLRELGIATVAVYSEADRTAVHVRRADEAYLIGPGPAAQSYLVWERIIETALRAGAQAIHPGYGFLAENARFATAVEEAGLTWIGPPPSAIDAMGSKTAARDLMKKAGVPIVPGTTEPVTSADEVARLGDEMGWPIAIKAASGGGGKGLKVVRAREDVESAFASAQREGQAYFADPTVYVEKFIEDPRHVEVQVLADSHGTVIHLGERDCSIQRRHQKLIEESPSQALTSETREAMEASVERACRQLGYVNAGTFEFLLGPDGTPSFIEVNCRLQVEHPVTEMTTGIDIVREQLRIAAGERLPMTGRAPRSGHAIEVRINAEDPRRDFAPTPGIITRFRPPLGPGVRVDTAVIEGAAIPPFYDSMIAKVIVHDDNRDAAIARAIRALEELEVEGIPTTRDLAIDILRSREFRGGDYSTSYLAEMEGRLPSMSAELA